MGNVLGMEKQQQIQVLARLGWSTHAISRQTGVDRKTIARHWKQEENQPKVPSDSGAVEGQNSPKVPTDFSALGSQNLLPPEAGPADLPVAPPTNSSVIHPYAETIRSWFLQRLTAQRMYQDLVEEHGYKGSYDSVKRYVRKLRKRLRHFSERLPHLPGREAQVDFGKATCRIRIDGKYRRVWLFKMTLSCSKHAYEELVERQDIETFLRCHERAFAFFGGVPEIVTLDNIKSGVLQASIFEPILNQTYLAFATHWRFAANPCMPRRPEHKGVVERDIGYTKHNALDGRIFENLEEANRFLRHWNKHWAQSRIHGTTKCQVWKLFRDVEQPQLRPLADTPFAFFRVTQRKVDVNGLVEVEVRYYGVPPRYVGEMVVVHYNQQWVKIYSGEALIITHRRLEKRGKVCQPVSCLPFWKHPDLESQERYYCRKALEIGPNMHQLVYQALCKADPLAIRRVRGFLSLGRTYGASLVEEAAAGAVAMRTCNYHTTKALCEQLKNNPEKHRTFAGRLTQNHELIRPLAEYDEIINRERNTICQ
jgi:transposase